MSQDDAYQASNDGYSKGTGGGGIVVSIVEGAGISVNNADPENPVISADLVAGDNITLTTLPGGSIQIDAADAPADPHQVLVDIADAVPGYLVSKIISADSSVAINTLPIGGGARAVNLQVSLPATSIAARAFPFSNVDYHYLELCEVTPPGTGEFSVELTLLVTENGSNSPSLLRFNGASNQSTTGSSKFVSIGGYVPPQWLAAVPPVPASTNDLYILEMPPAGGKVKFILQAAINYLSANTFVSILDASVSPGATLDLLNTAYVVGAPLDRDRTYLQPYVNRIAAGAGIVVDTSNPSEPIVSTNGGGIISVNGSLSTMTPATCRNAVAPPGVNNGGGAVLATFRGAEENLRVGRLTCFVKQTGGGNCTLGIYSQAGALLGRSAPFTPNTLGLVTVPIAFNGAGGAISYVDLVGGVGYYFALHCDSAANGAQFYGTDAGTTFGPQPWIGWSRDNVASMPASIAGVGSENSQRFLIAALTTT